MADTYFKTKLICEYVIPLAILVGIVLIWAGFILKIIIQYKIEKWREKRNGKVRKEDDAV